jgi:DNA-binding CsgD family transcriptional regulator
VEGEAGLLVTERLSARALAVPLLCNRALVALRRDQLATAAEYVSRAESLVGAGIGATVEDLSWALAIVRREQHGAKAAVEVLEPVYAALPVRKLLITQDPGAAPELVRLAMAAGADDHARQAAAAIRTLATDNPRVASLTAAAAHAEGLLDDDLDALRAAVRAYRTSPRNLAKAAAMEDAARAERTAGDKTAAVRLLDEALAIYATAGAHRDHARVVKALRGLGVRRRAGAAVTGARTGWDSLTEAELRVVRLVAQGMTNRAVASTLFLSPHTVDTHIRHAFAKLGVSTRVELTRKALAHEPT